MKTKWIIIAIVAIVTISGGAYLFFKTTNQTGNNPSANTQPANQTQTTTTESDKAMKKTIEISLTSQGFTPATITINVGSKVIWTNNSGENATVDSDPHPIHTSYTPLNLGNFSDGEKLELVFDKAGTYSYHNHLNSSQKGTIIVK